MKGEVICDFKKFKTALENLGYTIPQGNPRKIGGWDLVNLNKDEVKFEIDNSGDFYLAFKNGKKQKVFLYKKEYHISGYENSKPRYHVKKCRTFLDYSESLYRVANTGSVIVWDMDIGENVEVSELPLCKNCLELLKAENSNYTPPQTSKEFEKVLKDENTDLKGYLPKWSKISKEYREKQYYTCEICGFHADSKVAKQFIQVHHKDGNKKNNEESNLQCLCIECHSNVNSRHQENFSKGANKAKLDSFIKKYR